MNVREHTPKDPTSPCKSILDIDTSIRGQPRSLFCTATPGAVRVAFEPGGRGYLDAQVLIEGAKSVEQASQIDQVINKHGVSAWCDCRILRDRVFVDLPKTHRSEAEGLKGGNPSGIGVMIDGQGAVFLNEYIHDDDFDGTFATWKAIDDRMRASRAAPPPIPTPTPSSPPAPSSDSDS